MNLHWCMILWAIVFTALLGLVHRYMWVRWVRDMHWPRPLHILAQALLIFMSFALPTLMATSRMLPLEYSPYVAAPLYMWFGVIFYFLVFMGSVDLLRGLKALWHRIQKQEASAPHEGRRRFLGRMLGGSVGVVSSSLTGAAYVEAKGGPRIERVDVPLKRFPAGLSGLKIVQISDLHVGPTIDKAYVEEVVRLVMSCRADLIAVTGDMVDGTVERLREAVAPLAQLKAPLGVFYVTGNHEYYSGVEPWLKHFQELGMRVLANEHQLIESGTDRFYVAGIHDHQAGRFGHKSDIDAALAGTDPSIPTILLAHQPRSILQLKHPQVCLQLSGHTHAGQIWPFGYLVHLVQPYVQGLYAHGESMIYVNRGTGYWGPPMRLPWPSEITELTLRSQA